MDTADSDNRWSTTLDLELAEVVESLPTLPEARMLVAACSVKGDCKIPIAGRRLPAVHRERRPPTTMCHDWHGRGREHHA